jgi:iron complex transport system substrate-binding protein
MRVISLLPSATELVYAVGGLESLVGVSHECDYPPAVAKLPVLTSSRITSAASSRAIDAAVREVLRDALSIYTVDDTRLAALAPDVIITQDLCEVCAVSLDDVRAAVVRLAHREAIDIVSLRPTRLAHVLSDVERVATAIGRTEAGHRARSALEARIAAISARASALPTRPSVITLEWLDPLMVGGTWMPELVALAGGTTLAATAGGPAPTITSADLAALAPDIVVIKPCGFTVERTLTERALIDDNVLAPLAGRAEVYVTDGNAYFNRSGPRLVDSLEILAACIHPHAFADFAAAHAANILRLA